MNVFEAVKQSVTTRQAAEFYGFRVNRAGMIACPFHNDRTPSMKVDRKALVAEQRNEVMKLERRFADSRQRGNSRPIRTDTAR